ncbi:MAG: VOC family protein [Meiothermus sp.]|nr:VOC family protein [Meiothermus sp.]
MRYDAAGGTVWVNFPDGFVLRFDRTTSPPDPGTLTYLGPLLEDFAQVDAWYERLSARLPIEHDLRETYRQQQGPYGFILRDPNGCAIKVFKYHQP